MRQHGFLYICIWSIFQFLQSGASEVEQLVWFNKIAVNWFRLDFRLPSPESGIQNPESRNTHSYPLFQIPYPISHILCPESRIHNPQS